MRIKKKKDPQVEVHGEIGGWRIRTSPNRVTAGGGNRKEVSMGEYPRGSNGWSMTVRDVQIVWLRSRNGGNKEVFVDEMEGRDGKRIKEVMTGKKIKEERKEKGCTGEKDPYWRGGKMQT